MKLIRNKMYIIDSDFSNGGIVKLLSFAKIYCRVEDPDSGMIWETMINRLSELPEAKHTDTRLNDLL